MMLGTVPNVNDKEQWVKALTTQRQRYAALKDKVNSSIFNYSFTFKLKQILTLALVPELEESDPHTQSTCLSKRPLSRNMKVLIIVGYE
jgi:hypothetical protein